MHLDLPPDPFEFLSSQNLSHRQLIYVPFMHRHRETIIFADFIHYVLSLYQKVPVGFSPIRLYYYYFRLMMPMKVSIDKTLSFFFTYLWYPQRFSLISFFLFFMLPLMINIIFRFDQKVGCQNKQNYNLTLFYIKTKLKQCPSFL